MEVSSKVLATWHVRQRHQTENTVPRPHARGNITDGHLINVLAVTLHDPAFSKIESAMHDQVSVLIGYLLSSSQEITERGHGFIHNIELANGGTRDHIRFIPCMRAPED